MTKEQIYTDYENKYGIALQSLVLAEECGELIQVVSKFARTPDGFHDYNHLAEEIADVEICIEQIKQYYAITDTEVKDWKRKKLERMEQRLLDDAKRNR